MKQKNELNVLQEQLGHYDNIGHYQHDTEVFLDSKHALRLIGGRKGNPNAKEAWARHDVIGLVKYGPAVIRLYKMGYANNPYVDEILIKLEKRIEEAEDYFRKNNTYLKQLMQNIPSNTNVQVVKSAKPFHLKPNFGGNPYANKGVLILAQYDQMMTLMETCRAYGLLKRSKAHDIEYHGGRFVRRVFICPGEYLPCDITRDDIRNKNEKALAIIEARGMPNEAVLAKKRLPEFGPQSIGSDESNENEVEELLAALENMEQMSQR